MFTASAKAGTNFSRMSSLTTQAMAWDCQFKAPRTFRDVKPSTCVWNPQGASMAGLTSF